MPECTYKAAKVTYNVMQYGIGPVMNRKLIDKANYLLSKEKGTVFKDPGGKINIALAYPNTYSVGMSSLGFQGIYGFLNSMNDVVCERVFLPDEDDIEEYTQDKYQTLFP